MRSAYHLAVDERAEANGGVSNPGKGIEIWTVCWSLNVPNNVVCLGGLP
jgi:hypothetical protein